MAVRLNFAFNPPPLLMWVHRFQYNSDKYYILKYKNIQDILQYWNIHLSIA